MADFLGLMKQAAELKLKMEADEAELDQLEVEGVSGAGLVTVRLSGKGEMKGVKIDNSLLKPEEKIIMENIIVAAHGDARRKAEALLQEKIECNRGPAVAARNEVILNGCADAAALQRTRAASTPDDL